MTQKLWDTIYARKSSSATWLVSGYLHVLHENTMSDLTCDRQMFAHRVYISPHTWFKAILYFKFLAQFFKPGSFMIFFFSECLTYCTLAHRLGSIHQSSNYLLNQSSSWCSQSFNVTYKAHIKQIVGKECLCEWGL